MEKQWECGDLNSGSVILTYIIELELQLYKLFVPRIMDMDPVVLQRSDAVARIPANGSAAFNESCTPIR